MTQIFERGFLYIDGKKIGEIDEIEYTVENNLHCIKSSLKNKLQTTIVLKLRKASIFDKIKMFCKRLFK